MAPMRRGFTIETRNNSRGTIWDRSIWTKNSIPLQIFCCEQPIRLILSLQNSPQHENKINPNASGPSSIGQFVINRIFGVRGANLEDMGSFGGGGGG